MPSPPTGAQRWSCWLWAGACLIAYLLALNILRDRIPAGLNNDVAEEALRGVYLVESGRFEPFSLHGVTPEQTTFGNSMETLFLYLLGGAARILGTTALAIHATTWLFALSAIGLTCLLTLRIAPALPPWIPLLLTLSSTWLFHYARSGLRANTAPFFLLLFTLLLKLVDGPARRPWLELACGATMGLSLYGYTSCRVLPIAFALHAALGLLRAGEGRPARLRCYSTIVAGAFAASLPNLLFFMRWPGEFLFRGAYVVRGGREDAALNILKTFLLPVHYPKIEEAIGPTHYFDGVSVSLTAAGLWPLHPVVGVACLMGLVAAWKLRREPATSYLLCAWLTGTILLGIAGPSLTRLLLLLPVYLVFASVGLGEVVRRLRARWLPVACLLILIAVQARAYFVTYPRNPSSRRAFGAVAATPMGDRARVLAAEGARIVCVESSDQNVIRYLTHDFRRNVRIVEFMNRPFDPGEIPIATFRPHVLLVERHPGFEPLRAALGRMGTWKPGAEFDEFEIQPGWK
jgi:hypothetical protein